MINSISTAKAAGLVTAMVCLLQVGNASAADLDDTLLASAGEFEIGNGESKAIAHHNVDTHYRVCVRTARHSVPLKVEYDGKNDVVAPGDCADFEAMNIRVSAGGKLDRDTVLIGKYHHIPD